MQVDIWSDVACPWCYLGKRRFERALGTLAWADEVEVHWRAYVLDPTATAEPKNLSAAIEKKYGTGAFDRMVRQLTELGEPEGLSYRFDRALRVSTVDAHRLLAWAWRTGGAAAQGPLKEGLLRAYFVDGLNVADHDVLQAVAVGVGLDGDEALAALTDPNCGRDDVLRDLEAAMEREITGVPAFLVADRLLIPGAQDVDTFISLLTRAYERFTPSK